MAGPRRRSANSKNLRIGVISDLHVGSPWAPWPQDMTVNGSSLLPNPVQEYLTGYLQEHLQELRRCYLVILLGDIVHGNNRRESGRKLTTAELEAQVEAAVRLLEPLRTTRVAAVAGTGYHDSIDIHLERMVVRELGGEWLGRLANIDVAGSGVILNVAHGVSQSVLYYASMLDRESLHMDAGWGGGHLTVHPDVVLRGHVHHAAALYMPSRLKTRLLVLAPCWQAWNADFAGNIAVFARRMPHLGTVMLELTESGQIVPVFRFVPPPALDTWSL